MIVDVGTRSLAATSPMEDIRGCKAALEVHFHDFQGLPSTEGEAILSPEFPCFGRHWKLEIYPGGDSHSDPGKVALYLIYLSRGGIEIDLSFSVKKSDGKQIAHWNDEEVEFVFADGGDAEGAIDFSKRSRLIDALVNGTLIVEVGMKLIEATGDNPVPPFVPANPIVKHMLKRFMDEKSADVSFEVASESAVTGARKRAKTASTMFYAHHSMLQDGAPDLADLCRSANTSSPVPITDVTPDTFHQMLYYIYGGIISEEELVDNAKQIIDAADKYGVVNLKLEAEACYARSTTLTVENMLDNLLYADSKNCALLKEVVMDFVVDNGKSILGKVSFKDVPGSMMTDLLTAMTREKKTDDNSDYETMRVSTLRTKLHEKGLDIDGSRETMIALLEKS